MSVSLSRTAIVLLASGLSRRYGRRDKLLAPLSGAPLIEHSAAVLSDMHALTRVAVCPSENHGLRNRLTNRFVIALNHKPRHGLGHSIALGVHVALQFKPEAIVMCMGDMPFLEPWMVDTLLARLGGPGGADIVHAGSSQRVHPPTAFGEACFDQLRTLDGDDGAKRIIGQGGFNVLALDMPAPLLVDVDTPEQLRYAERQMALRDQYEPRRVAPAPVATPKPPRARPPSPPVEEEQVSRSRSITARIS